MDGALQIKIIYLIYGILKRTETPRRIIKRMENFSLKESKELTLTISLRQFHSSITFGKYENLQTSLHVGI